MFDHAVRSASPVPAPGALFDQFPQRDFKAMSGTKTTVAEAEQVLMRAARQSGAFPLPRGSGGDGHVRP